jgi:hypothetical protein
VDGVRAESEDAPDSLEQDVSSFVEDLSARDLVQLTP